MFFVFVNDKGFFLNFAFVGIFSVGSVIGCGNFFNRVTGLGIFTNAVSVVISLSVGNDVAYDWGVMTGGAFLKGTEKRFCSPGDFLKICSLIGVLVLSASVSLLVSLSLEPESESV